jgi:CheY-like chemotaxis protein
MPHTPPVVAVFNTSPDTVDLLRVVLQQAGFVVVSTFTFHIRDGVVDLETFMRQHAPNVILYDVAPPYDANWALFQHLKAHTALAGCHFVITSPNAAQVQKLADRTERVFEVIGKPYDLDEIVRATKEALRTRPTR